MRENPSLITIPGFRSGPLPHPSAASRDTAAATFPRWGKDMCRVTPGARKDIGILTETPAALRSAVGADAPGSPKPSPRTGKVARSAG